jgi:hypothetical protein
MDQNLEEEEEECPELIPSTTLPTREKRREKLKKIKNVFFVSYSICMRLKNTGRLEIQNINAGQHILTSVPYEFSV